MFVSASLKVMRFQQSQYQQSQVPSMYQACTVLVPLISGLDPFGSGRRWTVLMNLAKSPDICRNFFQVHDHSGGIAKEPRTALRENFFHVFLDIFQHVYRRVLSWFTNLIRLQHGATAQQLGLRWISGPGREVQPRRHFGSNSNLSAFIVYSNYII